MISPSMNTAPLVGLVNVTVGGVLLTMMLTNADVLVAPRLSVAIAFNTCVPLGAFVQVRVNGLFVFSPSFTPSTNNSRCTIVPSVSVAVVVIEMFVGAKKPDPFVGVVIATVGKRFVFTVTLTAALTFVAPSLSIAEAVNV